VTVFAFGIAGLSLMGVPPSGGFTAKLLLLAAAIETGQWWWALVVLGGGLLTGGYLYRVLAPAVADAPLASCAPVPRSREAVALALALVSMVLGFVPLGSFGLLQIGRLDMGISP
jgi:multicomponent Na+:H+ antiporter subunit D